MRYVAQDIICTIMTVALSVNFLVSGNDTSLILALMFWILSEIYRLRMNVN